MATGRSHCATTFGKLKVEGKSERSSMPKVQALHHVRGLNGHSKPQLMLCENSAIYLVKFQCPAFDSRKLVAEYMASEIARSAGLPVPDHAIIEVSPFLIDNTPALSQPDASGVRFSPGRHFGSRFVERTGGAAPADYLPQAWLLNVINRATFAGIFVLDKWCANGGPRKAVFRQDRSCSDYAARFIGHDMCFGGAAWKFNCFPENGFYRDGIVYQDVGSWENFEPFLSRLLSMTPDMLWQIAQQVPQEWYDGKRLELEDLVAKLLARRSQVHQMVARSIESFPKLFPSWRANAPVFLSGKAAPASAAFWVDAPTTP